MKNLLIIAILTMCLFSVKGQQLPIFSLYSENGFVLNPAIAGSEDHGVIVLSYRDQWSGMEGRPRTINGSYRTPIGRTNMGIGGHIMNDASGPSQFTAANVAFSYHISFRKIDPFHWAGFLRKSKISLGISLSGYHHRLRGSELVLEDPNDEAALNSNEGSFRPNVGLGVYYYFDNFYLGFSSPQIIPLKGRFTGLGKSATVQRENHYFLVAGGKIPLGQGNEARGKYHNFYIEPMVWFRYVKGAPYQYDGYVRFRHKNIVWLGVGYRSSKNIVIDAGFMILNRFKVGYAYDLPVSAFRADLGHTHEIIVSYHFKSNNTRSYGVR